MKYAGTVTTQSSTSRPGMRPLSLSWSGGSGTKFQRGGIVAGGDREDRGGRGLGQVREGHHGERDDRHDDGVEELREAERCSLQERRRADSRTAARSRPCGCCRDIDL